MRKEADMTNSDLDELFGAARQQPISVSADLMARVLADADALQPIGATLPSRKRRVGALTGLLAAIGGIGGLVGLSTAAMAGVWIGFAEPTALTSVTDVFVTSQTATETVNVLPGFDDFLYEG
jgi:hypothetical protein